MVAFGSYVRTSNTRSHIKEHIYSPLPIQLNYVRPIPWDSWSSLQIPNSTVLAALRRNHMLSHQSILMFNSFCMSHSFAVGPEASDQV